MTKQQAEEIAQSIEKMLAYCEERGIDPAPALDMMGDLAIRAGGYDVALATPSDAVRGSAKIALGAAIHAIAAAYRAKAKASE